MLRRFTHHLSGRRRALAAVFGLGLAGAAVSLSTPLLGKAFVDAVASSEFAAIPAIAAALVGLAVLDLAFATLSGRVHARLSADVLGDLRASLFARCVDGPLEAVESFRHGDLLTRFGTDVPRIQTLLVDGVLGSLQNLIFLGVAAAITFSLSPALALWSFLGMFLALLATAAFRGAVESKTRRVREAMADLSHFLSERLSALRALRLHRSERDEEARLAADSERLNREVVGFQVLDAMATGAPGLLLTLALAWIYLVGGRLLESGTISLGTFVAFVLYQGRLFGPAMGLLGLVRNLQEARVSLARVAEVMGPDPLGARPPTDLAVHSAADGGAIVLRDVAFAYAGKPPVFAGLDLRVRAGERVGLFGASGAGKSTLVHLLFGLRQPTTGAVIVEGRAAHDAFSASRPGILGYAGAEPFLLHATVEENLRYGNLHATREELARAAHLAEAHAFIAALPDAYATVVGGRGLALSDGQRQRLGIARLFLRNPRIYRARRGVLGARSRDRGPHPQEPVGGVCRSHGARHLAPAGGPRGFRPDPVPARWTLHDRRPGRIADAADVRSQLDRPGGRCRRWIRAGAMKALRFGVVDTGVNPWHSHVRGNVTGCRIYSGPDRSIREDGDFHDSAGHGTAVAGVIREAFPDAEIFAVRVFGEGGAAYPSLVARGILRAAAARCAFVNVSLAVPPGPGDDVLAMACRSVLDAGCVLVASARPDRPGWLPAALPGVYAVMADDTLKFGEIRERGPLRLVAPGRPRDLAGVPREANLAGHSFACARGLVYLARQRAAA